MKVGDATRQAWLVAYLPAAALTPAAAESRLARLLESAPVAAIVSTGATS